MIIRGTCKKAKELFPSIRFYRPIACSMYKLISALQPYINILLLLG